MATKLQKLLSLVLFSTIFDYPVATTAQECPYPCYPPPTGPGNNPTVGMTPPLPTTPPATFSPPLSTTPPATIGYFPFTPPSTPFYYGVAPPPPEPMVPWFPFYYRRPPHQDQSSSLSIKESRNTNALLLLLLFAASLFCFPLVM